MESGWGSSGSGFEPQHIQQTLTSGCHKNAHKRFPISIQKVSDMIHFVRHLS